METLTPTLSYSWFSSSIKTWSSGGCPGPLQWIWNKMMFKVPSKPNHTVIKVLFMVNSHFTWHLNT